MLYKLIIGDVLTGRSEYLPGWFNTVEEAMKYGEDNDYPILDVVTSDEYYNMLQRNRQHQEQFDTVYQNRRQASQTNIQEIEYEDEEQPFKFNKTKDINWLPKSRKYKSVKCKVVK